MRLGAKPNRSEQGCRMRKAVPVCGALVEIVAVSPHHLRSYFRGSGLPRWFLRDEKAAAVVRADVVTTVHGSRALIGLPGRWEQWALVECHADPLFPAPYD